VSSVLNTSSEEFALIGQSIWSLPQCTKVRYVIEFSF